MEPTWKFCCWLTVCFKTFAKILLYPIIRTCYSTTKTKHIRIFFVSFACRSWRSWRTFCFASFWRELILFNYLWLKTHILATKSIPAIIHPMRFENTQLSGADGVLVGICIQNRSSIPMRHQINYLKLSGEYFVTGMIMRKQETHSSELHWEKL